MNVVPVYAAAAVLLVSMATCVKGSGHYQLSDSCEYQGKTYEVGDNVETPNCEYCACRQYGSQPSIECVVPYCPPPGCVDSIAGDDPKCPDCGRICPNGPNCLTPSGETIPNGTTVTVADGTTCHCEEAGTWGYLEGICT